MADTQPGDHLTVREHVPDLWQIHIALCAMQQQIDMIFRAINMLGQRMNDIEGPVDTVH